MMPEQVWDEANRLNDGLELGRPAGSAMPLVWAHAEYLKLLRSALDGKVFDRIPPVEQRYAKGRARSKIEVFKMRRPVKTMRAGCVLRITAQQRFRVTWTSDGWKTKTEVDSTALGY